LYSNHILLTGPVAQWIEQQPSKLWVTRSNRVGVTKKTKNSESRMNSTKSSSIVRYQP
jgi:hypothetical protein